MKLRGQKGCKIIAMFTHGTLSFARNIRTSKYSNNFKEDKKNSLR